MTTEFKKVLVAYDGSEDSNKAVEAACAVSKGRTSVTLLHVYGIPIMAYTGQAGMPQSNVETLNEVVKRAAEAVVKKGLRLAARKGVKAKGEVIESTSNVEAIVTYASSKKFDLIVIGTRGNTGFKRLLVGSVSSGVVNHAHCPVLVVR
jgi:nucleotide-binding universal stress UspA family protein